MVFGDMLLITGEILTALCNGFFIRTSKYVSIIIIVAIYKNPSIHPSSRHTFLFIGIRRRGNEGQVRWWDTDLR